MAKWYEMTISGPESGMPHLMGLLISNDIKTWVEEAEGDRVRIKIYIPWFEGVENHLSSLKELFSVENTAVVTKEIEDEVWEDSWKKFFDVVRVGEKIVIKPPWKEYSASLDEIVIEIEPRMSFGTGYHPTTTGTLTMVEKYVKPGMKVLDVGCGSGIQSFAAARLGASFILAVDFDPICVREMKENYEGILNQYPQITRDVTIKLSDGFEAVEGLFDVMIVNVNMKFIQAVIDEIPHYLQQGGLFLSGSVGPAEFEDLNSKMIKNGMEMVEKTDNEGWCQVVYVKK